MLTSAKIFLQLQLKVFEENIIRQRNSWRVFTPLFVAEIYEFYVFAHLSISNKAYVSEGR